MGFDCEVFWQTVSTYAARNSLCPYKVFGKLMRDHEEILASSMEPCAKSQRWWDVVEYLKLGRLTEAIAVLEIEGEDDFDWAGVGKTLSEQPSLARCFDGLPRPASRAQLIQHLGSLSVPFVLVRTHQNMLLT